MSAGLQALLDRQAITDVMVRYATSIDNRDFDRLRSCFAKDAIATGFGDRDLAGPDAIVEFIAAALARFGTTQHLIGNHVLRLDERRACLTTDLQATHFLLADPKTVLTVWGTYHDEMTAEEGEWRIRSHRLQVRGTQTTTQAARGKDEASGVPGAASRQDR